MKKTRIAGHTIMNKGEKLHVPNNFWLYFLLFLLVLLTFFPLLKVGFTTADDANHYLELINPNTTIVQEAIKNAIIQARFQFFFTHILSILPYTLFSTLLLFKILAFSQIILNFILFSVLAKIITKSRVFAFIVFLFLVTCIQNSWEHNLLTSYPFIFSFAFNLFLGSLIAFLHHRENGNNKLLIVSLILFFFSLLNYEIFILYLVIYFFIVYMQTRVEKNKRKIKQVAVYLRFHLIILILFFVCYQVFRTVFPSTYDGTDSFNFNIIRAIITSTQFALSGLPGYIFSNSTGAILKYSDTYSRALPDIGYILANARIEWLIRAIISSVLTFVLFSESNETVKKFRYLVLISCLCIILPVSLHGFIQKYQDWVITRNTLSYTPTYFSYFGWVLLFTTITFLLKQIVLKESKKVFIVYAVIISLAVFRLSLITDYSNYAYTKNQNMVSNVWNVIDEFVKTEEYKNIVDTSVIYMPTIAKFTGDVVSIDASSTYWSQYLSYKTKKTVRVVTDEKALRLILPLAKNALYYVGFSQESNAANEYIIFAPLNEMNTNKSILQLHAPCFTLFTHTNTKRFKLVYEDQGVQKVKRMNEENNPDLLAKTAICEKDIDLTTVTVSNYLDFMNFPSEIKE